MADPPNGAISSESAAFKQTPVISDRSYNLKPDRSLLYNNVEEKGLLGYQDSPPHFTIAQAIVTFLTILLKKQNSTFMKTMPVEE